MKSRLPDIFDNLRNGFLLLLLPCWLCLSAGAQTEVTITLQVLGPGVASFGAPRPHLSGQSLTLTATPVAGARFVQWQDGLTNAQRTLTVPASAVTFTASFENLPFNPVPDFSDRALQAVSTNNRPQLDPLQLIGGRLRLAVNLPGRHGYRLHSATNLAPTAFAPVAFAGASNAPLSFAESFGGPGPVELWVTPPASSARAFYFLQLDNGITLPVLYFADVTQAVPGAEVTLHGANLTGTVVAQAGTTNLAATLLDPARLRVIAPAAPGSYTLGATVSGVQAIGTIPLTVMAATNGPRLDALPAGQIPPGGLLRLTGTNFGTNLQVWLDDQLLSVLARNTNGGELFVRLPAGVTNGRLAVVSGGVRSTGLVFNATSLAYTPHVPALTVVANPLTNGAYNFTPHVPALTVVAGSGGLYNYTPFIPLMTVEANAAGPGVQIIANVSPTSGARLAIRWGHPDFNNSEYFSALVLTNGQTLTNVFSLPDVNSEYEIQTEGAGHTGYHIEIRMNGVLVIEHVFNHTYGTNRHEAYGGVGITRSSPLNIYGEQNIRANLSGNTLGPITP